jgi:hypothetical protein
MLAAKMLTSVTWAMSRSSVNALTIARPPSTSGTAAETTLPKITISNRAVIGNVISSARRTSLSVVSFSA